MIGAGIKGPPSIETSHTLHEFFQYRTVIQHEGVNGDTLSCDTLRLFKGFLRSPLTDPTETQGPKT